MSFRYWCCQRIPRALITKTWIVSSVPAGIDSTTYGHRPTIGLVCDVEGVIDAGLTTGSGTLGGSGGKHSVTDGESLGPKGCLG